MTSLNLVIGYHKLDTKFFTGHVQHTTFHSDASQGRRRVKEVKNWYRDREIGRGTFGTVFLERSERGESRAVKEIAKDKGSLIKIDYRRELMAMAILAKHDALFVQLFGWYESDNYVHIAMEYISYGHLRNYLEVERSESEAKVITRQLLEGLVVIHQEGFAHRDLKPENIFVVSASPVWVKIGDFGLAKLVRDGTAFRTQVFSRDYIAPELGISTSRETSEYTNAVDIWAVGCIAHEMLTRVPPFRNLVELCLYCTRPEFPRESMLVKNISEKGMEIVESMLALRPELRITAKEALDSEWLRQEDEGQEGLESEVSAGPAFPEVPSGAGVAKPRNEEYQFHKRSTDLLIWDELIDPSDKSKAPTSASRGEGYQSRERSTDLLIWDELIGPSDKNQAPTPASRGEGYQSRKRSIDLLMWDELIGPSDKNQAPTAAPPAVKKEDGDQSGPISARVTPVQRQHTGEPRRSPAPVQRQRTGGTGRASPLRPTERSFQQSLSPPNAVTNPSPAGPSLVSSRLASPLSPLQSPRKGPITKAAPLNGSERVRSSWPVLSNPPPDPLAPLRTGPVAFAPSPQRVRNRDSLQQLRGSSSRVGLWTGNIAPTPAGLTSPPSRLARRQPQASASMPELPGRAFTASAPPSLLNRRITIDDIRARGEAIIQQRVSNKTPRSDLQLPKSRRELIALANRNFGDDRQGRTWWSSGGRIGTPIANDPAPQSSGGPIWAYGGP